MNFTKAQQDAIMHRTQDALVSAGAGSGKTYTLSRRYINILVGFNLFFEGMDNRPSFETLKPSRPSEIVTITYTEAGALEMKSRIYALIQNVIAYTCLLYTSPSPRD